jgi:two-component system nitrogen regulation response regulator GlnG
MAHILVCDDEPLLRWALAQRLEADGHRVTQAETGAAALAVLATSRLDLVLLDLKLPDISGLEVLGEVRRHMPRLPVLMMTAFWAGDALAQAQRLGVQSSLPKPLDLDRVAAAVHAALEDGGANPALARCTLGDCPC